MKSTFIVMILSKILLQWYEKGGEDLVVWGEGRIFAGES